MSAYRVRVTQHKPIQTRKKEIQQATEKKKKKNRMRFLPGMRKKKNKAETCKKKTCQKGKKKATLPHSARSNSRPQSQSLSSSPFDHNNTKDPYTNRSGKNIFPVVNQELRVAERLENMSTGTSGVPHITVSGSIVQL